MNPQVDVLVPTYNRPMALAVTLACLVGQTYRDFRLVVSDQSEDQDIAGLPEIQAIRRVLEVDGSPVEMVKHLPRRGMAEQRQFLLELAQAPYVCFLDDDLVMEPYVLRNMMEAIHAEQCGFVGCAVIGLTFIDDIRLHEQEIEFWDGPVQPEEITPEGPGWWRYQLHNAANLFHVARQLGLDPLHPRRYKVAWAGGCVLYDAHKLHQTGGFNFWRQLPAQHSGEDALAQLQVMRRFGGCGLIPSGVYHQQLPTTLPDRDVDAPRHLGT